jgi:hypothetical protein
LLSTVAAAPFLAGCSTISSSGDSVLEKREPPSRDELSTESRPPAEEPADATDETVSPRAYPTKPPSYGDDATRQFVESYERAYRRNDLLGRRGSALVTQGFSFDWSETIAADEEAGVGRCQYRYDETTEDGDGVIVGDSPTTVVTYYVDDSMLVRTEATGEADERDELDPDPWRTGVILEPAE